MPKWFTVNLGDYAPDWVACARIYEPYFAAETVSVRIYAKDPLVIAGLRSPTRSGNGEDKQFSFSFKMSTKELFATSGLTGMSRIYAKAPGYIPPVVGKHLAKFFSTDKGAAICSRAEEYFSARSECAMFGRALLIGAITFDMIKSAVPDDILGRARSNVYYASYKYAEHLIKSPEYLERLRGIMREVYGDGWRDCIEMMTRMAEVTPIL